MSKAQRQLKSIGELEGLEAQQEAARHLQIPIDKPCAAAYFTGKAWPQIGERGNRFFALIQELKRIGLNEDIARSKMFDYFNKIPSGIINSLGQDGRPFTQKELDGIIKAAYKDDEIKSYGCNSHMWDLTCPGPEICHFRKQLSKGKTQSRESAHYSFVFNWMGKDAAGKKILPDSDVRVYLALEALEKRRGYQPGSNLYVSWRELSELSGITQSKIGTSLMNLFWVGLIAYKKGIAKERGTASEVQRVLPIPKYNGIPVGNMVGIPLGDKGVFP